MVFVFHGRLKSAAWNEFSVKDFLPIDFILLPMANVLYPVPFSLIDITFY
jgi:hypothetical protein